ncbi:hypothetical protein O181_091489 [Austropuccinia psidii MF-1]|uniref:Uncharacterized protein n=1 Tax=Austropuccinia psidii MF-1 TaxID=1389203 RepID=A0A9Q3IXG3_9BASI|nr:hypothetical protein [Austropuccinia psidii MF-1]
MLHLANGLIYSFNFFTIQLITAFTIWVSWQIRNPSHPFHHALAVDPGYGNLEAVVNGPPKSGNRPPTLVHLSTYLLLDAVTRLNISTSQIHIPGYLQLEYPEVPSGVGASRNGYYFPKGPFSLLNNKLFMVRFDTPE